MNIKAALQQRAKELNIALPKLLQHYAMERFLYRLSLSPVADRFLLEPLNAAKQIRRNMSF